MTREQAIKTLREIQARGCTDGNANAVDSLVALGMLKLDEPKEPVKLLAAAMSWGQSEGNLTFLKNCIERAGLKLVEK